MQDPQAGAAPGLRLAELLPRLVVQLDVAAIGVFVRPVLAGDAASAPLCFLGGSTADRRASETPPQELQCELVWMARRREVLDDDPDYGEWLKRQRYRRVEILPGPGDRVPTVYFFCFAHREPRPDLDARKLALATLHSLAGRLAPPPWLPLRPLVPADGQAQGEAGVRKRVGLQPIRDAVAELERLLLRRALRVAEGNKSLAAKSLRMTRSALYRKLRRYGLLEE